MRQLVTPVEEIETTNPEFLEDSESEFPNELAAIEACDKDLIPNFQIEAMLAFVKSDALFQLA